MRINPIPVTGLVIVGILILAAGGGGSDDATVEMSGTGANGR